MMSKTSGSIRFLVAVDFSEASKAALEYAFEHAKRYDGELTLAHVIEPLPAFYPFVESAEGGVDEGLRRLSEEALKELEEAVPPDMRSFFGDRLGFEVVVGRPAVEIVRLAEALDAAAIIMGIHGHSAIEEFFLGGTTDKVLRRAPCTVICVRPKEVG